MPAKRVRVFVCVLPKGFKGKRFDCVYLCVNLNETVLDNSNQKGLIIPVAIQGDTCYSGRIVSFCGSKACQPGHEGNGQQHRDRGRLTMSVWG